MVFFIICILLFFFCIKALRKQSLNAQKMKKELLPRGKPIQQKEPPQPKEKPITTTVKISRYDYDDIETMVAETAEADTSLMKSIYGRDYSDYLKPHHGSKAYKAVAEYFGL